MQNNFDQFPDDSKIWIFQANRNITADEKNLIQKEISEKLQTWVAHSNPLTATFTILNDRFVVIALNQYYYEASGCAIDSMMGWFKDLNNDLNIDFFDRTLAYFDGNEIKTVSALKLKSAVTDNTILRDTKIFNNLISTKADLNNKWLTEASNSHLNRFF